MANDSTQILTSNLLNRFRLSIDTADDLDRSTLSNLIKSVAKYICVQDNSAYIDYTVFLHNKITIDNQFVTYCDENGVEIKAFNVGPVASWKSSTNDIENFVFTGIYKISIGDLEFWHSALFHKGNQYEDEVSFFIILKKDMYDKYITFRNSFDKWVKDKDRSVLEIEVIGGDPIEFGRNITWDDVFLEEETKNTIISSVEGFLKAKDIYKRKGVPWKRGLLFWGKQGTGKTTTIKAIISQYPDLKPVTIQPGHSDPDDVIEEAFSYAEQHAPSLLFFEDIQELLKSVTHSHFLQLLDGVKSREGLLIIATGNELKSLEENLTNRPRRFDKVIEFAVPGLHLTKKYLEKWFGSVTDKTVDKCVKSGFTFAHLQEIYFNAVDLAILNNREEPNKEDIEKALVSVKKSKDTADKGFLGFSGDVKPRDLDSYMEEKKHGL